MASNAGLNPVMRSTYRALIGDGLLEITLGFGLLAFALYVVLNRFYHLDLSVVVAVLPGVLLPLLMTVRRRVTYPRAGYARIRRDALPVVVLALTSIIVLLGLVVFVLDSTRGRRSTAGVLPTVLAVYGMAGAAILALIGWRSDLRRYYIHAALVALSALIPWALRLPVDLRLAVLLGAPGIELLGLGVAALVQFLRRYPKPAPEEANART